MPEGLEVADVIRRFGADWRAAQGNHLDRGRRRMMAAIEACRTAQLGATSRHATNAAASASPTTCRNRHCPKCQGEARARWLADRQAELPPVPDVISGDVDLIPAAQKRGVCPVIPYRSNIKEKPKFFPKALYNTCARVEQFKGNIERVKRTSLRCEKIAQNYASFVAFTCAIILHKSVHTAQGSVAFGRAFFMGGAPDKNQQPCEYGAADLAWLC